MKPFFVPDFISDSMATALRSSRSLTTPDSLREPLNESAPESQSGKKRHLMRRATLCALTMFCLSALSVNAQPASAPTSTVDQPLFNEEQTGRDEVIAPHGDEAGSENSFQGEHSLVRSLMSNPRNPLIEIITPEGDLYLELFEDAAPRNTALILELAQTPEASPVSDRPWQLDRRSEPENTAYYYDGASFTHDEGANLYISFGLPEPVTDEHADEPEHLPLPSFSAPDEINGRGLGLEQQRLLDPSGRPHPWLNLADEHDFQQRVLAPLYRSMGISDSAQLAARQDEVMERLQQMNLMQAYEAMGYRYNAQLASRRPVGGSVLMANDGPGSNSSGLILTLVDTPWLTGTHTVVGRLVSGQAIARAISHQPSGSIRINQLRYLTESP